MSRLLCPRLLLLAVALALAAASAQADDAQSAPLRGQRVFTAGHSFHVFMPGILTELARAADIKDHAQVGVQSLGGSRTLQHWNLADEKNKAKEALKTGKVDVLTLSPIYHPDEGIDLFTALALEHNPNIRITVQEFWLPYDVYDVNYQKKRPEKVDRNSRTGEEMRRLHGEYFKTVEAQVQALNQKNGKTDHRRPGAGPEKPGGPLHRRHRPRHAAAQDFGRVLPLRCHLSPQPGRPADAGRAEGPEAPGMG
jgi:hypothetical protein